MHAFIWLPGADVIALLVDSKSIALAQTAFNFTKGMVAISESPADTVYWGQYAK